MADATPPPAESVRAGHEVRDLSVPLVVAAALILFLAVAVLLVALGQVSHLMVPREPGATPPVVMPGEAPVGDRIQAIPAPRLDPLTPNNDQRPEDLRADRQPELRGYGWVEPGQVARIPIDRAMDAVVEGERTKRGAKK